MMTIRNAWWIVLVGIFALVAASPVFADEEDGMLQVGQPFVDFELAAHDGSIVTSADLAGRPFLLFFYPKADTPGWTLEATRLRDSWEELEGMGVTVLGVSYDSPDANRRFAEKNALPFLLLSDPDHKLAKEVGAGRALIPFAKRVSYLVGADGRILAVYPKVDPETHAAQVVEDYRRISASSAAE